MLMTTFPLAPAFTAHNSPVSLNRIFRSEGPRAAHSIYFQVLGEQGYVGLVLYLMILAGAFWSTTRVIRAAQESRQFAWAGNLARRNSDEPISLLCGGAALSMAYYDFFIICVALLVPLRELVAQQNVLIAETSNIEYGAKYQQLPIT